MATISTTDHRTPPLRITQHQFGNNDTRILISQGPNGVAFPTEDIKDLINALQEFA